MKLKEKIIDGGLWKSILYLLTITLIFGIVLLMNFTEGDLFDFSKVKKGEFWTVYGLTVGLSLMVLLFGAMQKKDKLKRAHKVRDVKDELLALDRAIIENGLYDDFSEEIKTRDKERKKAKYKRLLIRLRARAKTQADIDKLKDLISETDKEGFDITTVEVKGYKSININTILGEVEAEDEGDNLIYTGWERIWQWVLPQVISGVIFTGIMLALKEPGIKAMNIDAYIQLAMRIYMMTSYLLAGIQYGEYSINTVYFGVLISRKDEVLRFFEKKNMRIEIAGNDSYKYKATVSEVK